MPRAGFRFSHMPFVAQKYQYQCFHLSDVGLHIKTTSTVSRKVRPNIETKENRRNATCLMMQRRLVDMCMHR